MILALDRGRIRLTGADRVSFLHNLTTNDIKRLRPGAEGCFATMVNRTGKLIGTLKVRVLENEVLLDTDRLESVFASITRSIVIDDVEAEDVTGSTQLIGVYGPGARELLDLPDLPPWGLRGSAMRVPIFGVEGFELWLPAGTAPPKGPALSAEALELLRIEAGHPRWGAELDETIIPVEANLEAIAVSYSKGCYVGQEIIQRIKTYSTARQSLRGLGFSGDRLPSPGDALEIDGTVVGKVTSIARSPAHGPIGLGYLKRDHLEAGTRVTAGGISAVVRDLPFKS